MKILIAFLFVFSMAFAQDSSKRSDTLAPSTLVLPIAGVPLSAEIVELRITTGPDGNSMPETRTAKVYRDADGR